MAQRNYLETRFQNVQLVQKEDCVKYWNTYHMNDRGLVTHVWAASLVNVLSIPKKFRNFFEKNENVDFIIVMELFINHVIKMGFN